MLKLEIVTELNIDNALEVQKEIFPEYSGKNNYIGSLNEDSKNIFFLIFDDKACVGISGIYYFKNDFDSAWLAFFGILEPFRKKGFGKAALKLTEEYAKKLNFKYMRLFTDKENNDKAINFYKKNKYKFEDYDCPLEPLKDHFSVVIGSKAIAKHKLTLWNNKFINISKQTKKQNEGK